MKTNIKDPAEYWTKEDSITALQQGWDVFLSDDVFEICKLDDPEGVAADMRISGINVKKIPSFKSDAEIKEILKKRAAKGDTLAAKAFEFVATFRVVKGKVISIGKGDFHCNNDNHRGREQNHRTYPQFGR